MTTRQAVAELSRLMEKFDPLGDACFATPPPSVRQRTARSADQGGTFVEDRCTPYLFLCLALAALPFFGPPHHAYCPSAKLPWAYTVQGHSHHSRNITTGPQADMTIVPNHINPRPTNEYLRLHSWLQKRNEKVLAHKKQLSEIANLSCTFKPAYLTSNYQVILNCGLLSHCCD